MKHTFKIFGTLLLLTGIFLTSCVKDDFDKPDVPNPCDIKSGFTPNITIQGISDLFGELATAEGSEVRVFPDSNLVLEAKVVSNDEAGNFYKILYLQDETGAVSLSIDGSNLFNDYPVGQTVHLNLSGLTVEFDTWVSIHEIGLGVFKKDGTIKGIGRIPVTHLTSILKNEGCRTELTPIAMDLVANQPSNLGKLVKIDNVQFAPTDTAKTYADSESDPPQSANLTIEDCDGKTLTLRSSGYASFAGEQVPNGKGSITGIYTKYGSTYQLIIRDTDDVQFTDERCGNGNGEVTGTGSFEEPYDIPSILSLGSGTGIWVKGFLVGVMETGGSANVSSFTPPFNTQTNVYIAPTANETDSTQMLIVQLPSNQIRTETNLADNENLIGKEIKYYGNVETYFGLTGLKETTGYWLIESNTGVKPSPLSGEIIYKEDFEGVEKYGEITSMTIVVEAGTKTWQGDGYNGKSAEISAYNSNEDENKAWLITPAIDLTATTAPKLTFNSSLKYFAGDILSVYVSTNFDETNPSAANWIEITEAHLASNDDPDLPGGFKGAASGEIDLSAYKNTDNIRIGWYYNGSGNNNQSTKYRVDDILIID